MLENLRTFVFREAGANAMDRVALLRHLAPRVYFERSYRFNELRDLVFNDLGSEYVSSDPFNGEIGVVERPAPPVADPLHCITVQPFNEAGDQEPTCALLRRVAGHWRDVQADAEDPDFDNILRHAYIEPHHLHAWRAAAVDWKTSRQPDTPATARPPTSTSDMIKRKALIEKYRHQWGSIESDMKNKRVDSLSDAARVKGKKGWWYETPAVDWAKQRGKLPGDKVSAPSYPRTIHKIT